LIKGVLVSYNTNMHMLQGYCPCMWEAKARLRLQEFQVNLCPIWHSEKKKNCVRSIDWFWCSDQIIEKHPSLKGVCSAH